MGVLEIRNLCIGYAGQAIIKDFSLEVAEGELFSLLGPSGAGKTTILRAVAGLVVPDSGDILIDGRSVIREPAERRNVVMVFQKALLFPFMDVTRNIGFGLRMAGVPGPEAERKISRIMALTGLEGLGERKVQALSGGQQQRVSLARALVLEPSVLLLDEPLSNLDAALRQQMRELIQDIQSEIGITTLFVTHDQAEALMLSHRIGLLLGGRLRQVGSPRSLFYLPVDPEVARFFGGTNFWSGTIKEGRFISELGDFPVNRAAGNGSLKNATIRPEDIRISTEPIHTLEGRVHRTHFEGTVTRIWVRVNHMALVVLTPETFYKKDQIVWLDLPAEKIRIFPDAFQSPGTSTILGS
jgi:ABC-type Fe3+/spermidine/putrescine transport system ATPase subunit